MEKDAQKQMAAAEEEEEEEKGRWELASPDARPAIVVRWMPPAHSERRGAR